MAGCGGGVYARARGTLGSYHGREAGQACVSQHGEPLGQLQCENGSHLHKRAVGSSSAGVLGVRGGSRALPFARGEPRLAIQGAHGHVFARLAAARGETARGNQALKPRLEAARVSGVEVARCFGRVCCGLQGRLRNRVDFSRSADLWIHLERLGRFAEHSAALPIASRRQYRGYGEDASDRGSFELLFARFRLLWTHGGFIGGRRG